MSTNEQKQTVQDNEKLLQMVTSYRQAVKAGSDNADELARDLALHVASWVLAGEYRLAREPLPLEQLAAALAPAAQRELVERIEQLTDKERQTLALAVELAQRGLLSADELRRLDITDGKPSEATDAPTLSQDTHEQLVSRLAALSPHERQTLAQILQLIDVGYLTAGDVLALDIMRYERRRFDDERQGAEGLQEANELTSYSEVLTSDERQTLAHILQLINEGYLSIDDLHQLNSTGQMRRYMQEGPRADGDEVPFGDPDSEF